jgi:hypothetical protein
VFDEVSHCDVPKRYIYDFSAHLIREAMSVQIRIEQDSEGE